MRPGPDNDAAEAERGPGPEPSERTLGFVRWVAEQWPAWVVLAFAAWLLWPVPLGRMPLSADHTVHLTRIVLTARQLAATGSLSGWDPTWFFGFPLGELYPQLGDLLVISIHSLGLGALGWPQAYALGFYVVFAIQGLVLIRVGRLFGYGPWPGLIAALLMLADAGFTREGGWMYTVYFGVWPQALATSLSWLGLAELARALGWPPARTLDDEPPTTTPAGETKATLLAGLCFGAALLAHPIALPSLAIGGLLLVITLVPRGSIAWRLAIARCLLAGVIGLAVAAWWWVPMLQHKAWMASYGWLFAPLEAMVKWLREDGMFAQRMPMAVGATAAIGVALASVGAGRFARFVALFALTQWLLAASDVFWELRLDRFSEGFSHIQYQRFLIGAKPGLFLCAGLAVAAPLAWARRLHAHGASTGSTVVRFVAPLPLAAASIALSLWMLADSRETMAEHGVGDVQVERVPDDPQFQADYEAFTAWAREQWDARESDYRLSVRAPRNSHWFMDAPVWTATPQHKQGFTPGDNFVHKPEAGGRDLLSALGVRWVVHRERQRRAARGNEVARFGTISVRAHAGDPWPLVQVRGEHPVDVEVLEADLDRGRVRARLRGAAPGDQVVFAIAGYPRWRLTVDGEPLEWIEIPVVGDGPSATVEQRAAGELRGGKARGDDGTEPTLIAATLPEGVRPDATLELRYRDRRTVDWLANLISALALALIGLGLIEREARGWPERVRGWLEGAADHLRRALHPAVVAALVAVVLLGAGVRWRGAAKAEASELLGWVEAGAAGIQNAEPGPVKTDMLIRPAVLMRPRPGQPAAVRVVLDAMPEQLEGWLGLDDDQAQQAAGARARWARHDIRVEVRPADASDDVAWSTLWRMTVPHSPQRVPFSIAAGEWVGRPVQLRIVDQVDGKRRARLGLNLELGAPP